MSSTAAFGFVLSTVTTVPVEVVMLSEQNVDWVCDPVF